MIRRVFILVFLFSVACNALAAVSPHMEGDGGCSADCCRAARHNGPQKASAKLCCLTQCNQAAEIQGSLPTSFFGSGQDGKGPLLTVVVLDATYSVPSSELASSPVHCLVRPTHIYLSTGALLI